MKKSIYLSSLGLVLIIGIVVVVTVLNQHQPNDNAETDGQLQTNDPYNQDAVEVSEDSIEVVASDDGSIEANHLFIPWTINKNGGTFFLSQREGTVIEINGELGLVEVQDVKVSEDILHEGEAGFLGFTLDPEFDTTNRAYAYHSYSKNGEVMNRIVSLTLNENTWEEEDVLLEDIPGGEINNGGRLKFGPDGMLYATTGDTNQAQLAQDLDSLAGKILRMDVNGEIPQDNPFENSYVYSYGHRNAQGLAWDKEGNLYSSEHGGDGHDEINQIEAGQNYGWPKIIGDEEAAGMKPPIAHSGEDTWAPAGMAFFDGKLYVASLAGQQLFTYDIKDGTINEFYDDAGRLRDVLVENDSIFTITSNNDQRGEPTAKDDRLLQLSLTKEVSAD
ncbi:Glucose/arabinose dehydrogenase, beta-propeller fold [Salinibacillus kushneri]|uniref:Glucose/arabinose dehydrogenase, beta-propeller fold n=1 Tax=Salinibacillus kushneri TaxID=237682 RepID=A0A1I0F6G7_9BACI|nr:PQQ-dependent sugar dehydrogenase [Salinibacillus kushneri]SET53460.1 Glucose/arabinose dehydrogenase, beta-propeller fold [Salinibacillus kushneri]